MKILLATKNRGKINEINRIFHDIPVEFVGLSTLNEVPEVVEDGKTFHENALKKAMTYYKASSLPTLAEDSGLEVDALGGKPGIYSARYAGEDATDEENNRKLLIDLEGVPPEKRTARFVSVFCLIIDGKPQFFEGIINGMILEKPEGTSGFGYDPLFVPDSYSHSFAALGKEIKNRISHRARALKKLGEFLKEHVK